MLLMFLFVFVFFVFVFFFALSDNDHRTGKVVQVSLYGLEIYPWDSIPFNNFKNFNIFIHLSADIKRHQLMELVYAP